MRADFCDRQRNRPAPRKRKQKNSHEGLIFSPRSNSSNRATRCPGIIARSAIRAASYDRDCLLRRSALPVGGLVTILVTGHIKNTIPYMEFGLSKVIGVSILLIGTGTVAGIIKASNLQTDVIHLLDAMHMPAFVLAPLSGILMGGATASTTAGATVASQTFSGALLEAGVPALSAAAMIHAGATVIDSLPHGSFFHATGGAVNMAIKNRMRLIPYEALIGLVSTVVSVIVFLL